MPKKTEPEIDAVSILLFDLLYSGAVCSPAFIEEVISDLENRPQPYDDGVSPGLREYVDTLMVRLKAIKLDTTKTRRKRDG